MKVTAIIPAAGKGKRMGGSVSKQFLSINGKPILIHTLERINSIKLIDEIILVLSEEKVEWGEKKIKEKYRIAKVRKVVKGGEKRQDSVYAGLKEVDEKSDVIVVHDGVRPFFSSLLIPKAIQFLKRYDGVIEALPLYDTIKEVDNDKVILKTLERERLYRVQTPQIFHHSILKKAFAHAFKKGLWATDEAGLVEKIGGKIKVLKGSQYNIKITNPEDMVFAKAIFKSCKL